MTFAPNFTCVLTAVTTSSTVSASVPKKLQCPDVIVIGVPAIISRGSGIAPVSTAFLSGKATSSGVPRSRIVLTPDNNAFLTAVTARIINVAGVSDIISTYAS